MWKVVHMTKKLSAARQIQLCLKGEGILVRIRPVYRNLPDEENYFEIRVLQSEAHFAHEVILRQCF